jgi:ribosomal protein S18 acetylase RimI-like enzyme
MAGGFTVRTLALRDYDSVIALWRSLPGIGLDGACDSRLGIQRYLRRNPGLSFVACDRGRIVGAVLSGHDGRRGYLHHLAVVPTHRHRGIGRALVLRCFRALARQQIPKCSIFLFRTNRTGLAFWEHNGWSRRSDLSVLQKMTGGAALRKGLQKGAIVRKLPDLRDPGRKGC